MINWSSLLYVIFTFVSAYAISGINFDGFIKTNHVWEARVLAMVLSFSGGYLLTRFVLEFLNIV